ncbi:MAG: hypothetical protein EBU90_18145, partial [Proteobacteria bacterium]|nr:hypothetical protein [Pseudomonadota bacterium]
MSQQTINIGSGELTGDGESLRSAFQKVNSNFGELYTGLAGPSGPTGPSGGDFFEPKSFFVNLNGSDSNDGRKRGEPVRTIARALSSATTGDTIFISPGLFIEEYPLTVPKGVTVRGSGLRATTIAPTTATNTADGFLLDGETTVSDFNIAGQYWNTATQTGYAFRVANTATFSTRSPYIERITVINRGSVSDGNDPYGYASGDAGRGVLIDGSVINPNSIESALLFNEFTMIVPGSIGFHLKNGARVEMLTSFTYFAEKAIWAESGFSGRYSNGKTKLRVSGLTTSTLSTGTVITQTSASGFVNQISTIESYNPATGLITIDGKADGFVEYDPESLGHTVTLHGNATFSTADKKFGISSLKFDNTIDEGAIATGYVTIDGNGTDFYFLNDDCTFEFFFKPLALGQDQYLLSAETFDLLYTSNGRVKFYYKVSNVPTQTTEQIGPYPTNTWHLISLSKIGNLVYLHVNGARNGVGPITVVNQLNTPSIKLGALYNNNTFGFKGYIDNVRLSKGIGRYDTNNFTAHLTARTADTYTVLMLEETASSGVRLVDSAIPKQDITFSTGDTADFITLVDLKDFGAEVRAIACANVYGNYGVYANGRGNVVTLMSHNFSYIGEGGDLSNDPDLVNQANEVVAINGAEVYYNSIDQRGDVRIGDFLLADQQRGRLTFTADDLNLFGLNNISFAENGAIIFGDGTVQTTSGTKSFGGILYVDKNGNDQTANGSQSLPFRTIQAAHNYAFDNYSNTVANNSDVLIVINPGTYVENVEIYRQKTHLQGTSIGRNKSTQLVGNVIFNSSPASSNVGNNFSCKDITISNNTGSAITLSGNKIVRIYLDNIDVQSTGTQTSCIISNLTTDYARLYVKDSNFTNTALSSATFKLGKLLTGEFSNINVTSEFDFLDWRPTFTGEGLTFKESKIYVGGLSTLTNYVFNGVVSYLNSKITSVNENASGFYINSGTLELINTKLSIGSSTGTGVLVDGTGTSILLTSNLSLTTTSNKIIIGSVTHNKHVIADSVYQHILPAANGQYDLGTSSTQWRSLYVSTSTIYIGGTPLTVSTSGELLVAGNPVSGGGGPVGTTSTLVNGTYTLSLTSLGAAEFPSSLKIKSVIVEAPATGTEIIQESGIISMIAGGNGHFLISGWAENYGGPGNVAYTDYNYDSGSVRIVTGNNTGTHYTWKFDNSGILTLPNTTSTIRTEAFSNFGSDFPSIVLTPDPTFDQGQGLRIYAGFSEAGHLHLTASTSTTDLYLGDDDQYVKIERKNVGNVVIGTNTNTNQWIFGIDGNTTLPDSNLYFGSTDGTAIYNHGITITSGTQYQISSFENDSGISLEWFGPGTYPTRHWAAVRVNAPEDASTGSVVVSTGAMNDRNNWTFGQDGTMTFPDSTIKSPDAYEFNITTTNEQDQAYAEFNPNGPFASIAAFSHAENKNIFVETRWFPGNTSYVALGVTGGNIWYFNENGNLTFPDNTVQSTAWTGSTSTLVSGTYTVSLRSFDGALLFPNGAAQKNSRHFVPGTGADQVYRSGGGSQTIWTASTSTVNAAKVTVRVQF